MGLLHFFCSFWFRNLFKFALHRYFALYFGMGPCVQVCFDAGPDTHVFIKNPLLIHLSLFEHL